MARQEAAVAEALSHQREELTAEHAQALRQQEANLRSSFESVAQASVSLQSALPPPPHQPMEAQQQQHHHHQEQQHHHQQQ